MGDGPDNWASLRKACIFHGIEPVSFPALLDHLEDRIDDLEDYVVQSMSGRYVACRRPNQKWCTHRRCVIYNALNPPADPLVDRKIDTD